MIKMSFTQNYNIPACTELRVLVHQKSELELTLTNGYGEIFGSNLVKNYKYKFHGGTNFSVYSYEGCSVCVKGERFMCDLTENPMPQFHLALHMTIEKLCSRAEQINMPGPAIMIVGPQDMGKTTLCKFLINCAVRSARRPIFVDLDVGQNAITLPGTMSMVAVNEPLDPVKEFDNLIPKAYHFGHKNPGENKALYKTLISKLSYQVNMQAAYYPPNKHSACFINTCGWVHDFGFEAIVETAVCFEVRIVVVLGDNDRPGNDLSKQLKQQLPSCVEVMTLQRSPGVVRRERNFRISSRILKVDQYFHGIDGKFITHKLLLSFDKVQVYRAGKITLKNEESDSGEVPSDQGEQLTISPVSFDKIRLDTVLSVMDHNFPQYGHDSCIRGYVVVFKINIDERTMVVLSPHKCSDDVSKLLAMNYLSSNV